MYKLLRPYTNSKTQVNIGPTVVTFVQIENPKHIKSPQTKGLCNTRTILYISPFYGRVLPTLPHLPSPDPTWVRLPYRTPPRTEGKEKTWKERENGPVLIY